VLVPGAGAGCWCLVRRARVGVPLPWAFASVVDNSSSLSPLSRRTMLGNAALASSVVASMPIVFPLTKPAVLRHSSTHVNTAHVFPDRSADACAKGSIDSPVGKSVVATHIVGCRVRFRLPIAMHGVIRG
jgi:hypothetical protein